MHQTLFKNNLFSRSGQGYLHLGEEKIFLSDNLSKDEADTLQELGIIVFLKNVVKKYRHINIRWFGGEPTLDIELIGRLSEKSYTYVMNIV